MKGLEPGMEENLISFFHLDYPHYELLFCFADEQDPAVVMVKRLMTSHPEIPSRLIVSQGNAGPNPKINNLLAAYEVAAHDCVLISDSNVRVGRGYLAHVVASLAPGVGAVTAVVVGTAAEGLGGRLEATFLNSFYARWMRVSEAFGVPCIVGKSMLFRKSTMERIGGLKNLGRYIAEDYMTGHAMQRLGLEVVIMAEPIRQYIGCHPLKAFWSRHLRWGRIRKSQAPVAFAIEPFFGSVISGLFGAVAFHQWLGIPRFEFLCVHLLVWLLFDGILMRAMESRFDIRAILVWPLRELLAIPLWFHIASGSSVTWRGKLLRILPGGLLEDQT